MRNRSQSGVPAASIQPESIHAQSRHWPDMQLLLRSRGPGLVSLPQGQHEHMLICKWGRSIRPESVSAVIRCDGHRIETPDLPDESISFVPAGVPFEWEWTYQSESIHILLPPCALHRVAENLRQTRQGTVHLLPRFNIRDTFIALLLERLRCELLGQGYGTPLAVESIGNLLSLHLLQHFSTTELPKESEVSGLTDCQRNRVEGVIEERFCESLRLEELAQTVDLSPYHFSRQFKRTFGIPPHEFQLQRRIQEARRLLRSRDSEEISQIAACLGFTDESHFRRHFKRIVGITPGQYRNDTEK